MSYRQMFDTLDLGYNEVKSMIGYVNQTSRLICAA